MGEGEASGFGSLIVRTSVCLVRDWKQLCYAFLFERGQLHSRHVQYVYIKEYLLDR